jgi:hypothetical protein
MSCQTVISVLSLVEICTASWDCSQAGGQPAVPTRRHPSSLTHILSLPWLTFVAYRCSLGHKVKIKRRERPTVSNCEPDDHFVLRFRSTSSSSCHLLPQRGNIVCCFCLLPFLLLPSRLRMRVKGHSSDEVFVTLSPTFPYTPYHAILFQCQCPKLRGNRPM